VDANITALLGALRLSASDNAGYVRGTGEALIILTMARVAATVMGRNQRLSRLTEAEAFQAEGLEVAAVAGYVNRVNPDPARREAGLERLHRLIDLCREFGTLYLATETGSLNPDNEWADHPNSPAAPADNRRGG
jgi:hypothetical protein